MQYVIPCEFADIMVHLALLSRRVCCWECGFCKEDRFSFQIILKSTAHPGRWELFLQSVPLLVP